MRERESEWEREREKDYLFSLSLAFFWIMTLVAGPPKTPQTINLETTFLTVKEEREEEELEREEEEVVVRKDDDEYCCFFSSCCFVVDSWFFCCCCCSVSVVVGRESNRSISIEKLRVNCSCFNNINVDCCCCCPLLLLLLITSLECPFIVVVVVVGVVVGVEQAVKTSFSLARFLVTSSSFLIDMAKKRDSREFLFPTIGFGSGSMSLMIDSSMRKTCLRKTRLASLSCWNSRKRRRMKSTGVATWENSEYSACCGVRRAKRKRVPERGALGYKKVSEKGKERKEGEQRERERE